MNSNLLEVSGLHVSAGEKEILHGVDLTVGKDETHVLMGPNGTGKSTLGYAITGNPAYHGHGRGASTFDGEDITTAARQRAREEGRFPVLPESARGAGRDAQRLYPHVRSSRRPASRIRLWDFKKKLAGDDGSCWRWTQPTPSAT